MAAAHPTTASILEEFHGDPEAMAAEIVALRRVVAELRSLHEPAPEPIVIISPPERPAPPPEPLLPFAPRADATP